MEMCVGALHRSGTTNAFNNVPASNAGAHPSSEPSNTLKRQNTHSMSLKIVNFLNRLSIYTIASFLLSPMCLLSHPAWAPGEQVWKLSRFQERPQNTASGRPPGLQPQAMGLNLFIFQATFYLGA